MDFKVHSIHFDADQKLIDFIRAKVEKLNQFYGNIIAAEVFLRLENSKDNENKVTEIKLFIPGNDLFAKRNSKSFEESADLVVEALRRQLRKTKGKQMAIS
jgi:putative sigma-54 modulation protein